MTFIDARQIDGDAPPAALREADVCIAGSGPVGLALARELARQGWTVLVLESGGTEEEPETQALAAGRTTGDEFQPLIATRARRLGGTAHFWNSGSGIGETGFRSGLLHDVDLERREWLPHSVAWPFDAAALRPYYDRAQQICALGPCAYDAGAWAAAETPPLPLDPELFTTTVWQFGVQQTFTRGLVREVQADPRITLCLHATVAEVCTDPEGQEVTHLRVLAPGGRALKVRARRYVLATGGIENARLLLMSRGANPDGLGNDHDLVGRFFMEHQWVKGGTFTPASPSLFQRAALYDTRLVNGTRIAGKIDFTDDALRRHRLLNASFALLPRHRLGHRFRQEVPNAFVFLPRHLRAGRIREAARDVATMLSGLDYLAMSLGRRASGGRLFRFAQPQPDLVAAASWSGLSEPERRWHHFEVVLHTEQAPHPDNRVTLDDERDALGLPRARLHWEWRDADQEHVLRAERLFQQELARTGLGRYEPDLVDGRPHLGHPGLHHHMGTTRMHQHPKQGVLNEYGRVHGVANLYCAGLSTFPSGGYINPTLTIVALALRLADRLHAQLGRPPSSVVSPAPRAAGR